LSNRLKELSPRALAINILTKVNNTVM
jgi:hypothetical protein